MQDRRVFTSEGNDLSLQQPIEEDDFCVDTVKRKTHKTYNTVILLSNNITYNNTSKTDLSTLKFSNG